MEGRVLDNRQIVEGLSREKGLKRRKKISILKIVLVFSVLLVCILGLAFFTRIKKVEIETGTHYSSEEIKDIVIDDIFSKNTIWLFLKYRYGEKENIPFVEYIDVEWVNKNEVRIVVYDKNIIGCINYMGNVIYFDKDGDFVETSNKKQDDIPVISGIDFSDITLHGKINVENEEMFTTIMDLTQQISKYELDIDEIYFDYTYDVSLYADNIEIMLGKQKNYNEKLAALGGVLKEAKEEGLSGVLHMENYTESQENIIFKEE